MLRRASFVIRRLITSWIDHSSRSGLSFSCTQCGRCCKGTTNVFINETEAYALADHLNMKLEDFIFNFTEPRNSNVSLKTRRVNNSKHCIFLEGKTCSVYDVRPTQCRTYPFWPEIVMSKVEWETEGKVRCEGIKTNTNQNFISSEEIVRNLIVHQVHARGRGENLSFHDSMDALEETLESNPSLSAEFKSDFFSSNYSTILFEDDKVRIVDSTSTTAAEDLSSIGSNDNSETNVTYRRLELLGSLG